MAIKILALETSCDETAAAIVRHEVATDGVVRGEILSNIILSQIETHAPYGGVVPELAARAHLHHLESIIGAALDEAGLGLKDLDAIAATAGPGLVGGLMIGLTAGKALALAHGLRFIPINHLEGHALTVRLTDSIVFPYLLLLVSGGHCQLVGVAGVGDYRLYGTTRDDAVGEAFDKAAQLLGLSYPGGPAIEACAVRGDASRFMLPRPLLNRGGDKASCDFSFSGLKTALRQAAQGIAPLGEADIADLAAAFQAAIIDCLVDRTRNAVGRFQSDFVDMPLQIVIAGGVAANLALRGAIDDLAVLHGSRAIYPPLRLCTDNAAMIAFSAAERFASGMCDAAGDVLAMSPRPRWQLVS